MPPSMFDNHSNPFSYGEYLEISFSSKTDVAALVHGGDLYFHAGYCPFGDHSDRLTAFGPFTDGKEITAGQQLSAERDPVDGRYHYTGYLLPAYPMPGVSYSSTNLGRKHYDLRVKRQDVCFRLDAPGYNLIPSRSKTVRIPPQEIVAALRAPSNRGSDAH